MCIFWKLVAVEAIWGVFQDCWHLWPFPSGTSADVLHCSAVQVTLSLYSCGNIFKKIAKNRVPVHIGLNPSHLLMKLLLCLTVSCIVVICWSFYMWENWLCLNVTTEDQLEYCVLVFVVITGVDFIVWAPLSLQWIALTPEKKNIQARSYFL